MDNGMRKFDTGATRNIDTNKNDYKGFVSWRAMRKFGDYMTKNRVQADGSIRDSDNWKKGIPLESYESSLARHVQEFFEALENKDRERMDLVAPAIMFNIQGWMHERPEPGKE